jgi:PIN domain nuclease of toxin-antitoxin system
MKILLDTHALVWWWTDDRRLPAAARASIASPDNTVWVSAASAWEIASKHRLGKWPEVAVLLEGFDTNLRRSRFASLPITQAHAVAAGGLNGEHRDPFDRMLLAQARLEDLAVVTGDPVFREYGASVVW